MSAEETLATSGIRTGILLLEQIKPYETVAERVGKRLPQSPCAVILLEEEIRAGGMGMLLSDALKTNPNVKNKTVECIALQDAFVTPAKGQTVWEAAGLDAASIAKRVRAVIEKNNEKS